MSVSPATSRFATPRRALCALLIIIGAVGAGLVAAPVVAGKPGAPVAAAVSRDVAPVMWLDESGTPEDVEASREPSPVCSMVWRTDARGVMWVFVPTNHAAVYLADANGAWLNVDQLHTTWVWITDSADSERTDGGEWVTVDSTRPYCGFTMPVTAPR